MRLVTWNINSVRLRANLLARVCKTYRPDLICLQEIKCANEDFPRAAFARLGYKHLAVCGIKGYHGVAIAGRRAFLEVQAYDLLQKKDARHIAVRVHGRKGAAWVHNFYVPAGGDVPDAAAHPKFAYKLRYLEAMAQHFGKARGRRQILVGDLNVAPGEHDVWSHKQLLKVVCHTAGETERLARLQATLGWHDIARDFVPPSEKLYSWWSYRNQDWQRSNRGRRLDHIWTTPALRKAVRDFAILKLARGWVRPSDHVPVFAQITL